jgi:choline-sulfatase
MTRSGDDPDQLFNLANDANEVTNLADDPACAPEQQRLEAFIGQKWNLKQYDFDVRRSQARRLVVYDALRNGHYYPWDFQPLQKASERYMRNHMDLNIVESEARFPKK